MTNVLVFGQSGQLARCLADSQPQAYQAAYLSRAQADFSAAPDFAALIAAQGAQLVINATAYTAVDQAESDVQTARQVNAGAVKALADACQQAGIPLLHVSTDYVFDGEREASLEYDEADATDPAGVYGATKQEGEQAITASNAQGGQGYIFRTAWVYSAYGKNFLKTMLRLAEDRDALRVVADQIGTPTSAHDIATTLWAVAEQVLNSAKKPEPGIYHLVAQGHTSWHGFASEIFAKAKAKGWKTPSVVEAIPSSAFPTPAKRPSNSRLNTGKLATAFDLSLPQWQDSIALVLERLQQEKDASS